MNASTFGDKDGLAVYNSTGSKETAFTLIELMVVIATMAVLAVMLLPALAGTQSQSKVTACAARFRQWAASANLYANDNRGWLPSFNIGTSDNWALSVGTNMCDTLYPYGMDVRVWFCPMRPTEIDYANQWGQAYLGHPIQNATDLRLYFNRGGYGCMLLTDNYWVPRKGFGIVFPTDWSPIPEGSWPAFVQQGMPTCAIYGWPQRLHDVAVPYVPFVSDLAVSTQNRIFGFSPYPASPYTTNIAPHTAHFINGTVIGVNLAFADGHVASHSPSQMRCVYDSSSVGSGPYWFY